MKKVVMALATLSLVQVAAAAWDFVEEGLFEEHSWYAYDMSTHSIWSHLDVYVINAGDSSYAVQILSYYNPDNTNESGFYTLRVQTPGGPLSTVEVAAGACGNARANPNYDSCVQDPQQNAFTYLNLETLESWKMSDAEASQSEDWDMAFKTTDIQLNNGSKGPGQVSGALAYRNGDLFKLSGPAFVRQLMQLSMGDMQLAPFEAVVRDLSKVQTP